MLYPSMSSLLDKINSRYLLVNAIAYRSRKIAAEAEEKGMVLKKSRFSCHRGNREGKYKVNIRNEHQ